RMTAICFQNCRSLPGGRVQTGPWEGIGVWWARPTKPHPMKVSPPIFFRADKGRMLPGESPLPQLAVPFARLASKRNGWAHGGVRERSLGRDAGEDEVRGWELAWRGGLVGPGDEAVLVDEDEGAVGDAGTVDVGAVGAGDLALRLEVGEQGRVDPQLLLEG